MIQINKKLKQKYNLTTSLASDTTPTKQNSRPKSQQNQKYKIKNTTKSNSNHLSYTHLAIGGWVGTV